jgi:hypothetical protein
MCGRHPGCKGFVGQLERAVGWVRVMCSASLVQPGLLLAMMLPAEPQVPIIFSGLKPMTSGGLS